MASSTEVTSLTAVGGVGYISLSANWGAPAGMQCLAYMQPEVIEFWAATSNNRGSASKIGEAASGQFIHANITGNRWYWARVRDAEGNTSENWYPASATGGIAGATNLNPVQPSLTQLQTNISTVQQESINGDNALAGQITTVSVTANNAQDASQNATAQSRFRMNATGGPSGWTASFAMEARVSTSATYRFAGIYIDATSTQSRLRLVADQTVIQGSSGAAIAMFESNGQIQNAVIPNLVSKTITSSSFRTASSGRRVEISSSDNFLRAYDSSGNYVASIGEGGLEGALLAVNRNAPIVNAVFVNPNSSGAALSAVGRTQLRFAGSGSAVFIEHLSTGSTAHGLRAKGGSGSGQGLVGTSAVSGGFAFFAETGAYGPFTGAHPGLLPHDNEAVPGDIVCDVKVLSRYGISDTLTEVARSRESGQRNVIGVLESRRPFEQHALINVEASPQKRTAWVGKYDLATINGLGEGQVNVCGLGGDLEPGDLICTSDMAGKGQRQNGSNGEADDLVRRCTVARVRERVKFKSSDEIKLVSCIYLCG